MGLGIMGAQMASRLVGTGQNVMVYNRSVAKAEPLPARRRRGVHPGRGHVHL